MNRVLIFGINLKLCHVQAVKGVARDLFWEVIDQMAHEVSRSFCEARNYLLSFDVSLTDDILKEVLREMSR